MGSLRISVTDRCNLRCQYCMPEEEYVWLPREDILDFEEIARLAGIFASLGVSRARITGEFSPMPPPMTIVSIPPSTAA